MFDPAAVSPQAILATSTALWCALSRSPARVLRYFTSWPVLAVVLLVGALAVPKIIVGYIAPCGVLQDTIASGELLAGRPAYPEDLHVVVKRVLREHPIPATVSWLRGVQAAHLGCVDLLQLNAHPPLVAMALEPAVATLGYFRPILLLEAFSVASLVVMIWLWSKALEIILPPKQWVLLVLVLLGSQPALEGFRNSSLSALLAMLVVTTWYLLRTEREGWSGVVLSIAAGLKLFPIAAAAAMTFRRIRALVTLAVSCACIVLGIFWLHGGRIFSDYIATAHSDVIQYGWERDNYSLYANIRYFLNGSEAFLGPLVVGAYALLCVVAGLSIFRLRDHKILSCDFGMALAATVMCLFSPVVWSHYYIILFLPLCILSHYSRWWESKGSSVVFFLIVASVNMSEFSLEKLWGVAGTQAVSSLPTGAVLAIFGWLSVEAFKASLATLELHSGTGEPASLTRSDLPPRVKTAQAGGQN
jgi:hypothetical protein